MTLPADRTASSAPTVSNPSAPAGWQRRLPASWRSTGWNSRALALWTVTALVTSFGGTLVEQLGMPAPHLITGLLAGLVLALSGLARRTGARPCPGSST